MVAAVLGLTFIGGCMRFRGALNDLWLDELISLHNARSLRNLIEVFTAIHTDNNHYVNTMFLRAVGDSHSAPILRMLALLCGVAAIPAAFWSVAKRPRVVQIVFACLITFSYPLVHFASEARGYSGAILAGLFAFGALDRWLADGKNSPRWGPTFALAAIFGILSHLTFVFIWGALAVWSLVAILAQHRSSPVRRWIALHAAPALLLSALLWVDLRHLTILGGPEYGRAYVLSRLAALSLGWPFRDVWSIAIIAAPLAGVAMWKIFRMRRDGDLSWVFFACVVLLPGCFLLLVHPRIIIPRYFVVCVPFAYMFLTLASAQLRRPVLLGLLALFVAGNVHLYRGFLAVGRGNFSEALRTMVRMTPDRTITIASDNDYRSGIELEYYQSELPPGREILFIQHKQLGHGKPQWVILHREALDRVPPATLAQGPNEWAKVAYFPCSELSGQAWTIYQRSTPAASVPAR